MSDAVDEHFALSPRDRRRNFLQGAIANHALCTNTVWGPSMRVPRSADAVATAMRIMGLDFHEFFIPGGYGMSWA